MRELSSVTDPIQPESSPAAPARIQRTPFYFQSEGAWLFGWLHRSASVASRRQGVLICSPLGYEQVHAHRALRHLADALAEAGFEVLRFDYHGTGDSAGALEDLKRHATWLANIKSALGWMGEELGCSEISVVGLRLGAALAAQVAELSPVTNLVLWAPVVKGRAYVREMKAVAMAAGADVAQNKDIEAAGFVVTEQLAGELAGIDLLKARPRCRRTLVVGRDDLPDEAGLHEQLQSLGIEARQIVPPGHAAMVAEPHFTQVPRQAIAEIVAFLSECSPHASREVLLSRSENSYPIEAIFDADLAPPLRERAVLISQQPNLFGILSAPAKTPDSDLPTIVILNAGSAYHVGPNRLHVMIARRLAAQGFRCLRVDLCGLGDSISVDPAHENDPYPATTFRDIELALKYLGRELGIQRVVLMGLCSGAYAAFQAAAQLPTGERRGVSPTCPRLVESIIINPLTFHWQEGMTVESPQSIKFKVFNDCMAATRQPGKWLKLFTGQSKLGLAGACRILMDRWNLRRQARRTAQSEKDNAPRPCPSHPPRQDLPGDLARISQAGRRLSFFLSRADPGYDILTFYARRSVEEMTRAGLLSIHFIEKADHTFSLRAARDAFLQALVAHISEQYLPHQGVNRCNS